MTVTDAWKIYRMLDDHSFTICQYDDILAGDMMNCAAELEEDVVELTQAVSIHPETQLSSMSSIDTRKCGHHTKQIMKSQNRCVWCSRINLTHRKTTLKCKECGSGFCRDKSECMCWSHHLALGVCPLVPKRGTLKRNARDNEGEDDNG